MIPIPLPSTSETPRSNTSIILTDEQAIVALIDQLIHRSGLSYSEVARRLGVLPNAINQYRHFRRKRPSLWWMNRLAAVCGARIVVEWPQRPV